MIFIGELVLIHIHTNVLILKILVLKCFFTYICIVNQFKNNVYLSSTTCFGEFYSHAQTLSLKPPIVIISSTNVKI